MFQRKVEFGRRCKRIELVDLGGINRTAGSYFYHKFVIRSVCQPWVVINHLSYIE